MNLVAFVGTQIFSSASSCDNSKTVNVVMFCHPLISPQLIIFTRTLNNNKFTYILCVSLAVSVQFCILGLRIGYALQ